MTRRRWLLAGAAVVLVWAVVVGFRLAGAADDLRVGRDEARAARARLDATSVAEGAPIPHLRAAHERLGSAARATGGPLLLPVRLLPFVGRQLRSVHALAGAGAEMSAAALDGLTTAEEVLDAADGGGPERVAQLRRLAAAVDVARRRVQEVDLGPARGLVGPLAEAHDELADDLAEARRTLTDASAGARGAVRFLGGPRRYLLVAANNAEMRAGSGMWLSGGLLTTAAGSFDLGEVAPLYLVADPPPGAVTVDDADLAGRWGWTNPSSDWRALMPSPRFEPSARLARRMWAAAGRPAVDGVLVVDPVGLAAVVAATGPVEVDGERRAAEDILPLVLHEQYRGIAIAPGAQAPRRELLATLAGAAVDALDRGDWSPAVLVDQLAGAVRGRHLLAWSSDPVEQRGWAAAGMDGALEPDSVLVSLENRAGNKLDWFTHVGAELSSTSAGGDTAVTIRVTIRNEAPAGLPRYVSGPPPSLDYAPGTYRGILAVNVPGSARGLGLDGVTTPYVLGPDGPTQVVGTPVEIARGTARTLVVRFVLPGPSVLVGVEPSARVPAVAWRHGAGTWQDNARRTEKVGRAGGT